LKQIRTIAIAGTGNVAFHMGTAFRDAGISITGVYGRNARKRSELAQKLGVKELESVQDLDADLILICVKDDAIEEVSNSVKANLFVVHTSGSIPLQALSVHSRAGVIYPLQTISEGIKLDFSAIPILIEASDSEDLKALAELTSGISEDIHVVNSSDRETLHMAAVMVNNFTNHLVLTAKEIVKAHGLDWKLLLPLLQETSRKLKLAEPEETQTGPAKRGDLKTMEKHLSKLKESDQLLYRLFSERIMQTNTKTK
jgi:predicted short-subunit dehydrogenase-like oxidoreductase (DUF2520 family)